MAHFAAGQVVSKDSITKLNKAASKILFKNPDSASILSNKSLDWSEQIKYVSGKGTALKILGNAKYLQGDYLKALEYFTESFEAFNSIRDTSNMAGALGSMGLVHKNTKTYELALENYDQAWRLVEGGDNDLVKSKILNNLGVVYSRLNELDKAVNYYDESLVFKEKLGDSKGIANTLTNIGVIMNAKGQYDEAISVFKRSLEMENQLGNDEGLAKNYNNLANSFSFLGLSDSVIYYARKGLEIGRRLSTKLQIKEASGLLAQAHAEKAQFQQAYSYQREYTEAKDSLSNEEISRQLGRLESKLELERKEVQLELMNQNNTLIEEKQKNQRLLSIVIISALLLLIGLIGWQYRFKQKANNVLEEKNETISHSLKEREVLLKEIHHRVKNNLQIISSLLNLQSRFVKDAAAIDAVLEGKNRVKSMALIHQRLYQNDDIRGVDMNEYIESLVAGLKSSYKIDEERLVIDLKVEDLTLDIDTAIPLGLILNELITNTLKYAFPEERKGMLQIQLENENGELHLLVKDDGVGIEEDKNNQYSFGMSLIESLAEKLDASIEKYTDKGTAFQFRIKKFQTI